MGVENFIFGTVRQKFYIKDAGVYNIKEADEIIIKTVNKVKVVGYLNEPLETEYKIQFQSLLKDGKQFPFLVKTNFLLEESMNVVSPYINGLTYELNTATTDFDNDTLTLTISGTPEVDKEYKNNISIKIPDSYLANRLNDEKVKLLDNSSGKSSYNIIKR